MKYDFESLKDKRFCPESSSIQKFILQILNQNLTRSSAKKIKTH